MRSYFWLQDYKTCHCQEDKQATLWSFSIQLWTLWPAYVSLDLYQVSLDLMLAEVDACASAIVTVYTLRIFGLGIFQVHSNTRRRRGSRSLKILEKWHIFPLVFTTYSYMYILVNLFKVRKLIQSFVNSFKVSYMSRTHMAYCKTGNFRATFIFALFA